ncbi:ROK family protein [Microbacterium marinum]|uniref:ROK family protein n=1 Tax=Microbacterium marinum TaxID=421115 RepID=UPI00384FCBC4
MADAARRLESVGIIREAGFREGRRGGVAVLYELNVDRGHSLGIAIGQTSIGVVARDFAGGIITEMGEPLSPSGSADDAILAADRLIRQANEMAASPLLAAAVYVAHPVDRSGQTLSLRDSPFPAWHFDPRNDLDLGPVAAVRVDNDVNWAAVAERHLGSMMNCDDFVYIHLGSGLGAGIFSSGELMRGHRGLAGEVGYVRKSDAQDITQRLASLGLGSKSRYGLDVAATTRVFTDPALRDQAELALSELSLLIANLATLLNTQAIVFGGPLSNVEPLMAALYTRIPTLTLDAPRMEMSCQSSLTGASLIAGRMAHELFGF